MQENLTVEVLEKELRVSMQYLQKLKKNEPEAMLYIIIKYYIIFIFEKLYQHNLGKCISIIKYKLLIKV
jgi:hypothetical protein